ncbi:MAG: response regulator [Candidatus Omnitrophica bacterium]|nr:response regulator [Candidatus Omnitrophota bacterium]
MKKRILAVDDDRMFLALLKFKLGRCGFEVATAKNEKEFWDEAFAFEPDLVIVDLLLKNKMGTDTYQSLVDFGFDPNVPVIFVSGFLGDRPGGLSDPAGKPWFFSKPVDFEELVQAINHRLNHDEEATEVVVQNVRGIR